MATKAAINALSLAVQALAEKYEVSATQVKDILEEVPEDILAQADWKDLDAIVQEGLVSSNYTGEEEEEITGGYYD